jgi:hypothetical protein
MIRFHSHSAKTFLSSSVNFDLTKNDPRDSIPLGACSTSLTYFCNSALGALEPKINTKEISFKKKQI